MKQYYRLYGIPQRRIRIPILSIISFSFFFLLSATTQAQIYNSYARVTNISNGATKTTLTVSNKNETNHTFQPNEPVIVIQMQADVIGANTSDNANFGNLAAAGIGYAGNFDVAVIESIAGSTIVLKDLLPNKFTATGNNNVQLISFQLLPSNFSTTGNISAVAWNGTVGGVVALNVPGTFTINHNITADGQGFRGGARSANSQDGTCGSGTYRSNSNTNGAKGEGIYLNSTANYTYGRGKLLTGGGGGSQGNAGGGGGSNFSAGGTGGPGWACTSPNSAGGLGGIELKNPILAATRFFMGGGGGGGQGNDGESTAGANGGGIIIIHASTLTTGCSGSVRISANGNNSSNATGTGADGVGGAGAGGTILLHVGNFNIAGTCTLNVQANGGNGGNVTNNDTHGGGGGGGEGAIIYGVAIPPAAINNSAAPGTGGKNSSASNATSAGSGASTPGSIISGVGAVLPVRLIHFAAENINKKAVLNWTASDDASTTFTILHSTDGVSYTPIGTVNGTGNANKATNYSFTDANAVYGKNYYQLQMSGDATSRISYSSVVLVNMNEEKSLAVAWPNPAHDHFSIKVNNEYANKMHQVVITDLTGKLMYTNTYKPAGGIITVTPAQQLKPGMYIFQLTSEGYEQSGKLFIQ
ncbi:MAG TPA: T9SS type A sorting domain-containing protein [Niastella sp.]